MSIIDNVMSHINTPGSAMKLVPVVQVIALTILAGCLITIYYGVAVIHMCVMIFLATGLLCSLTFLQKVIDSTKMGYGEAQSKRESYSEIRKID